MQLIFFKDFLGGTFSRSKLSRKSQLSPRAETDDEDPKFNGSAIFSPKLTNTKNLSACSGNGFKLDFSNSDSDESEIKPSSFQSKKKSRRILDSDESEDEESDSDEILEDDETESDLDSDLMSED